MNERGRREQLTVLNAFLHDVATGTWISSLALVTFLWREARSPEWASAAPLLESLERSLMLVTWTSLAVVIATGVVRMITFRLLGFTGDYAADRVRLLKVKHAVLGAVFAAGTAWQAWVVYR